MRYSRSDGSTATGPADYFTGAVYIDGIRDPDEQTALGCAHVRFTPARPSHGWTTSATTTTLRHKQHDPPRPLLGEASSGSPLPPKVRTVCSTRTDRAHHERGHVLVVMRQPRRPPFPLHLVRGTVIGFGADDQHGIAEFVAGEHRDDATRGVARPESDRRAEITEVVRPYRRAHFF